MTATDAPSPEQTPVVEFDDQGQPTTTSRAVAEYFRKEHRNVLRDIREILTQVPENWGASNFECVDYPNAKGEARTEYRMTETGFLLLVPGFTGETTIARKIKYIETFQAMRQELERLRTQQLISAQMEAYNSEYNQRVASGLRTENHYLRTQLLAKTRLVNYLSRQLSRP